MGDTDEATTWNVFHIAHLFVNQDSRNGSTCKKGRGLPIGKSKGERQTYLFRQDLLFLPGKAVATDLQQIERPSALETSVGLQRYGVAEENTFEKLGEENLVFCGRPPVFTPSFPGAERVEGWRRFGWGVHREDWG